MVDQVGRDVHPPTNDVAYGELIPQVEGSTVRNCKAVDVDVVAIYVTDIM